MARFFLFLFILMAFSTFGADLPVLRKESQGFEVSLVQKILRRFGFPVELNGIFDEITENAIRTFQTQNGQFPHGIVNDSTWNNLLNKQLDECSFIQGIDISHYENEEFKNGDFPFDKLKQFKLDFCFVKGTHGGERRDPYFEYNFIRLDEHHMIKGVYHFFSLLKEDIHQQVSNFLSMNIDFSKPGILPPVLDIEEDTRPFDREYIISNRTLVVERIRYWLHAVEVVTGRKPMIYCRKSFWENVIGDPDGFDQYLLWVANYQPDSPPIMPTCWQGKWHFWQYTDKGLLEGIGKYDLNRFSGTYLDLMKMANYELRIKN
ncbi:MAG: GH25 family lysozyme [Saprospiraceae bacterium]